MYIKGGTHAPSGTFINEAFEQTFNELWDRQSAFAHRNDRSNMRFSDFCRRFFFFFVGFLLREVDGMLYFVEGLGVLFMKLFIQEIHKIGDRKILETKSIISQVRSGLFPIFLFYCFIFICVL